MLRVIFLASAVFAAAAARDPPSPITCNDPNFQDGGTLLGAYVTPNELSTDIAFSASTAQYTYGKPVHFKVQANGPRLMHEPKGVYLAVQVKFTGANGEAMGNFHDYSADMDRTPNCASSIFSVAGNPFNGTSHFSWTPSDHPYEGRRLTTTGNATFSLIWANNAAGDGVPNPFSYLKTLDLWDPKKWNPNTPSAAPPLSPASGDACVLPAHPRSQSHTYKGSPVFFQYLPEGPQTFAAQRCVRCRLDQRATCRSAKVECPTLPGAPVVEHTWATSTACEGAPTRSVAVPFEEVVCPGASHHSPFELEMDRFVPKLQRDYPEFFKDNATAQEAIFEYRRMLHLMQVHPEQPAVPSKRVDLVWHEHILDTEKYKRDTLRMFGHYVHHAPSFGGAQEKEQLVAQQKQMFKSYQQEFSEAPGKLWQQPMAGAGEFKGNDLGMQKSPDCCSAFCVKPDCASCVGCNAVDCGYMGDTEVSNNAVSEHLAPERFAGYVPTAHPIDLKEAGADVGRYLCSVSPHVGTNLSWTISGDSIYFKQEFVGEAWFGIGLNNSTNKDMGLADYMLVIQTRNFTGIKDLYKWDTGNGYPCWDIEYECSAGNGTATTNDVETPSFTRDKGLNTATWSRKLITNDYKDFPITNATFNLLFANGVEDYFTYHAKNFGACEYMNMYSGVSAYCWWA